MEILITFAVFSICFYVFWKIPWLQSFSHSRRKGLFTKPLTMFDVRELILKGDKDAAIRLYANLFRTDYKESKKAVDELERSIQKKNSQPE